MPNFATQTSGPSLKGKGKEKKKKGPKAPKKAMQALPAAVGSVNRSRGPSMGSRNSNVIITNEELISTVPMVVSEVLSAGLQSYQVQAGSTACFPWLSALAANFQSYTFRKLVFHYKPSCPTSTAGIVALAFDPDPSNDPPSTLQGLSAMRERTTGSAWTSLTLTVPPKALTALSNRKLVRTDAESVPKVSRPQYDCGSLYIYAGSGTAVPLSGLVYVSYSVELFVPQPPEGGSASLTTFTNDQVGCTVALPFGINPVGHGGLGIIPLVTATDTTTFYFPLKGQYLLSLLVNLVGAAGNDTSYLWINPAGVSIIDSVVAIDGTFQVFTSRVVLTVISDNSSIALRYATPGTGISVAALSFVYTSDPSSLPA